MAKQQTAPPPPMDETVPGGRYLVDGVLVDAEGRPLPPPATDQPPDQPGESE